MRLRAADRGVKVRLIVDDFMVEADRGFHAKSMVVDEKISVVATFNLDPRSANLNTECITIVHDPIISAKLSRVIAKELEIENAWHVKKDFNPDKEAGRGKRINLWFRGVVHKSIL